MSAPSDRKYNNLEIKLGRAVDGQHPIDLSLTLPGSEVEIDLLRGGNVMIQIDSTELLANEADSGAYGEVLSRQSVRCHIFKTAPARRHHRPMCVAGALLDPIMSPWDCGPFPVILREAAGFFGDWSGNETIYAQEALSTSRALLPEVLRLIEDNGDSPGR